MELFSFIVIILVTGITARNTGEFQNELISSDIKKETRHTNSRTKTNNELKKCCKNGGTRVMESFCICKKGFSGRYCQHSQRNCGPLKHDDMGWMGCNLCLCMDGLLSCLPYKKTNCSEKESQPMLLNLRAQTTDGLPEDFKANDIDIISAANHIRQKENTVLVFMISIFLIL